MCVFLYLLLGREVVYFHKCDHVCTYMCIHVHIHLCYMYRYVLRFWEEWIE